jgi:membrane-associated phospholipid phosphatase
LVSRLFHHQHHFMDVVAGFALGVCCIYHLESARLPVIANRVGLLLRRRRVNLGVWAFGFGRGVRSFWPAISLGSRRCLLAWVRSFSQGNGQLQAPAVLAPRCWAAAFFALLPASMPAGQGYSGGLIGRAQPCGSAARSGDCRA